MRIIKPKSLKSGDTIGVISPSASLSSDQIKRLDKNLNLLKSAGYKIKLGENLKKQYGHNAGTREQKLEDLHSMFEDDGVNAILSSRGGYNSNELLDYIDYGLIGRNPKIFCGYSDITFMHCAIHKMSGLVSFYGPMASTPLNLNGPAGDYTYKYFDYVACGRTKNLRIRPSKAFIYSNSDSSQKSQMPTKWKVLRAGRATGNLMGGHIFTVLNLAGTKYFPDFKNKILFWEDTESSTALTERFLWQFRMLGVFDKIKGMIVGRTNKEEYDVTSKDYSLHRVILDATSDFDFPIIADMDFGHTMPMFTIPYGIKALMDSSNGGELQLMEKAVK